MTPDTLHDALTLLPADLVAEADGKRRRRPARRPLKRWLATAACLALALLCVTAAPRSALKGATESILYAADQEANQEAAPEAPEAPIETVSAGDIENGSDSAAATVDFAGLLPTLTLRNAGCAMVIPARGYEWTVSPEADMAMTQHADVSSPEQAPEELPLLEIVDGNVPLLWSQVPDRVTVRLWQFSQGQWAEADPERVLSDPETLDIAPGKCLYELTARWEAGSVRYAFRTIVP